MKIEENQKLYKHMERGKVIYAINDFQLPFPLTFSQMAWFVVSLFVVILFGELPPFNMIDGAFLKYFGIPVAFTWFVSQKTFDGKKAFWIPKILCEHFSSDQKWPMQEKLSNWKIRNSIQAWPQLGVWCMFPIKYIENNLVFNHDGECFAYYELTPYNYSFLSPEEKYMVHDNFRQLIAQNRDGKIHALQIATEDSLRAVQERSKKGNHRQIKRDCL